MEVIQHHNGLELEGIRLDFIALHKYESARINHGPRGLTKYLKDMGYYTEERAVIRDLVKHYRTSGLYSEQYDLMSFHIENGTHSL